MLTHGHIHAMDPLDRSRRHRLQDFPGCFQQSSSIHDGTNAPTYRLASQLDWTSCLPPDNQSLCDRLPQEHMQPQRHQKLQPHNHDIHQQRQQRQQKQKDEQQYQAMTMTTGPEQPYDVQMDLQQIHFHQRPPTQSSNHVQDDTSISHPDLRSDDFHKPMQSLLPTSEPSPCIVTSVVLRTGPTRNMTPAQRRQRRIQLRAQRALAVSTTTPRPHSNVSLVSPDQEHTDFWPEPLADVANVTPSQSRPFPHQTSLLNDQDTSSQQEQHFNSEQPNLDRKQARVIRNREVALRARQAAKAKLAMLETENQCLRSTARHLQHINSTLKSQIHALQTTSQPAISDNDITTFSLDP